MSVGGWPHGLDEIKARYGDPMEYFGGDGTFDAGRWERDHMTVIQLPEPLLMADGRQAYRVMCHREVAQALGAFYSDLHDARLLHELEPYGGCYCRRLQRGGSLRISTHWWAIASDWRVSTCKQGTSGDMPQAIVERIEAAGMMWGGRWDMPDRDPMHGQFCNGY